MGITQSRWEMCLIRDTRFCQSWVGVISLLYGSALTSGTETLCSVCCFVCIDVWCVCVFKSPQVFVFVVLQVRQACAVKGVEERSWIHSGWPGWTDITAMCECLSLTLSLSLSLVLCLFSTVCCTSQNLFPLSRPVVPQPATLLKDV